MSNAFADIFLQAAKLNRQGPRRRGNTVVLPAGTRKDIIVCGDIHGNRHNLLKVIAHADLANNPDRILVLQEIIHGPTERCTEGPAAKIAADIDRSIELLSRAARLKVAHPQAVLFVLGNHDIAQVTGNEITKEGHGVCKSFAAGATFLFGEQATEIMAAMNDFLVSMPMAIRCPGGVLICHSLPSPQRAAQAGTAILTQDQYQPADFKRGGAAYEWTWGRGQDPQQLEDLRAKTGAEFFVVGHRHSGNGYEMIPNRGISIASDHDKGYILEFPADAGLDAAGVADHLKRIASLK